MNMTNKQRKALWICLAIVVASYAVRSIILSAMQMQYYQQQAIRAAQQRAAAKARPAPSPRASSTPAAHGTPNTPAGGSAPAGASASPANLSGNWRGKTAIAGRGICALRFELSEKELGHFAGYSSLACANFAPLMSPQDRGNIAAAVLNKLNPAEAILSGAMENGSIRFHVDKTIGTNSNGCAATSFTVTPFGSNQLAAEWQEGGCQGGHVILQKARN